MDDEAIEKRKNRFRSCNPKLFAAQIPQELFKANIKFRTTDRLIIVALEMDRGRDEEVVYTSLRRLARLLDINRETVRKSLIRLEKYGLEKVSKDDFTCYNLAKFWEYLGLSPLKPIKEEKNEYLKNKKELAVVKEVSRRLSRELQDREAKIREIEWQIKQMQEAIQAASRIKYKKPNLSLVEDIPDNLDSDIDVEESL